MTHSPLATAHRLLTEATAALAAAAGAGASDDELLSALTLCEGVSRQLDRLTVATITSLERRGTFTDRGYRSTTGALGDLLGWERFEARRRVTAAEQVGERIGLDGAVLPARLPATAAVFATGRAGLRHVEVVARVRVRGRPEETGIRRMMIGRRDQWSSVRRRDSGAGSAGWRPPRRPRRRPSTS